MGKNWKSLQLAFLGHRSLIVTETEIKNYDIVK